MAITIKDVARAAGVSHSTVSRALRDHPAIARETAARIKKIAAELGYVPSAVARGLKTSRSQALGVIVNRIDDPFFSEILQGIEDALRPVGYSLFVAASNRDPAREKAIAQAMWERRVDGLILCSTPFGEEHNRQVQQYDFPIVAVGNHETNAYPYMIFHDDPYGSRQATRYLIDLGHRKIAYLGNGRAARTTRGRVDGFCAAMQAAGLAVPAEYVFHAPNGRPESGAAGARHLLELAEPPTAVMCFNDMQAIGMIDALRAAGVRVPQDCSVVGFDDIPFARYACPPLTTFEQPKYRLGYEAAQMMVGLLSAPPDAGPAPPRARRLRGRLIVRQSTAPPAAP